MFKVVEYIKTRMNRLQLKGSYNAGEISRQLGVSVNELVFILVGIMLWQDHRAVQQKDKIFSLEKELDIKNESIEVLSKGNGRQRQMALIQSGLPIARKKRKDLVELDFMLYTGASDKELEQYFQISRSTLWRWKKEIQHMKEAGQWEWDWRF